MRDTLPFRISVPALALTASAVLFLGACSGSSSSDAADTSSATTAGSTSDSTGVTSSSTSPAVSSETVVSVMETVTEVAEEAPAPEPVAEESAQVPVLGNMAFLNGMGRGYGEVQPTILSENGVCGNVIGDITWDSWGGETATGTASPCVSYGDITRGADPHPVVPIVASDLGDCGGVYAYRQVLIGDLYGGQPRDICFP